MARNPTNLAAVRAAKAAAKPLGQGEPPEDYGDGLPPKLPMRALGVHGSTRFYLDADRQLVALPADRHTRLGLLALFGRHSSVLYDHWPRKNKDGDVTGWRPELVAEALMAACSHHGQWDPAERERGRGAWRDGDGGLILHTGGSVLHFPPSSPDPWAARTSHPPGLAGRYVYPAGESVGMPTELPASTEGAARLLALLRTWRWRRQIDAVLLLGWIGAAMIAGALEWRPIVWITGTKGTGKSTLQELLEALFDGGLVKLADTSEAYIRQRLRHQTLPVSLDEAEAEEDNRRLQSIVRLARVAASGGRLGRGGQDHQAVEFTMRSAFLFGSILMPPLLGQDRSRIAVLEMLELVRGAARPDVQASTWGPIGAQLRRRLVDGWPRWVETLEHYRESLMAAGHTARGADQFGTLLAAADLLLMDGAACSETSAPWIEQLQADQMIETEEDVRDEEQCLAHLLSSAVDPYRNGGKRTIAEWLMVATGQVDGDPAEAMRALGQYGLRLDARTRTLQIANSHSGLAGLFKDTRWAARSGSQGVWVQAVRRLPGADRSSGPLWFAGAPSRATLVPLDAVLSDPTQSPRLAV
jgi:hypothetical protein